MKKSNTISAVFGAVTLMLANICSAASIMYTGSGFNDANYGVTIAMQFSPNTAIRITDLGVFDGGSDGPGLQIAHEVGLWDSNGSLLASTTVTNADSLQDGFRFTSITPIELDAGITYILGAFYSLPGDKLIAFATTPSPYISLFNTALFEPGSSLTFPGTGAFIASDFRITANMLFAPVPLPSALWLFGSGLLGLIGVTRKKVAN